MKKLILCSILAISVLAGIVGCSTSKIQVIHNDNIVTNNVPMRAFNDESYIWENWTYSTNRIDSID